MRELVQKLVDEKISRRRFMRGMLALGFSLSAAESVLNSLAPLTSAQAAEKFGMTEMEGTGGEILTEQVKAAGVKYLFLGNGSGLGPLCDAAVDRPELRVILGVHENHCVSMADGYAKAAGETAFTMFSRVGTPNSTANIYNAMKDRTPIVIATDNADTLADARDGHEDIDDWLETVKQFTKWRWLVKEPERIPELTAKAFKVASTLPGGPTFLRFPRNILYRKNVKTEIFPAGSFNVPMKIKPGSREIEEAAKLLVAARSPVLYVGSEVCSSRAREKVVELAEMLAIPVTQASYSWAADFPTKHPLFLGSYTRMMRHPKEMDLFLSLGAHMPDQGSGPILIPRTARIIHGRIESSNIGTNYPVDVAIVADVGEIASALIEAIKSMLTSKRMEEVRGARYEATKKFTEAVRLARVRAAKTNWDAVPISWERLASDINDMIDRDTYIVEEFGTEGPKALNWFSFADGEKVKIGRTGGRALGWGIGAAIGVKLAKPDRQVLALQGDGGFLYGQAEALWSMSRYDIPIITIIFNNRSYNETRVRMFSAGGRQAQTEKDMICYLGDPDVNFVEIAEAFGIKGESVTNPGQIKPALKRAIETTRDGRPYLIDAIVARSGQGAESTWYPKLSVAAMRKRKV